MPPLPNANSAEKPAESSKEVVRKPIDVIALRDGFFKQIRRKENDKFQVPSMDKVGKWMKCLDPALEKKHQEMMKAKSRKKVSEQEAED